MPDPAKTFNDGGIKFVRQTITAKDADDTTVTYIVKKGSMKAGVKRVKSENENGVENKQAGMLTIPEGSLTLQFVNPTDKPPKPMQYITAIDTSGAAQNLVLWDVAQDWGAGEEAGVVVDISQKQAE